MKLKVIQDPTTREIINFVRDMGEFEEWDLMFDDIPESGIINELTFQEMLNKVRPTIKKYAHTPMRCRYVEKSMKLMWEAFINETPPEYKFELRWAYAHQFLGLLDTIEEYPNINPAIEMHFVCVFFGLLGENCERIHKYNNKYRE